MMIKRYVTDSMPEAMQMINRDLGKDAVILNQKEIYVGGFLGLFRKRKFEVIAAKDPQQNQNQNQKAARDMLSSVLQQAVGRSNNSAAIAAAAQAIGAQLPLNATGTDPYAVTSQMAAPNPNINSIIQPIQQPVMQSSAPAFQAQAPTQAPVQMAPVQMAAQLYGQGKPQTASGQVPVSKSTPTQSSATSMESSNASSGVAVATEPENDPNLLQEIRQMREMLKTLKEERATGDLPIVLRAVKERLLDQEIDETIVHELIHTMVTDESLDWKRTDEEQARNVCYDLLVSKLKSDKPVTFPPIANRVVHFVGPTGVGKTTTLAKLAAEQVLKNKKKVGFITSDTYRISAVDQLKTYASILNVPIEVVNSPTDLPKAMKNLEDRDLIFMDTAGRNFRNPLYISELNNLLKQNQDSLTFLVLSLTTKYKDMRAITSNFSNFKIDHVLFTKIDETESYGSILNIIQEFDLPPSYIANGQNVPNDIFPFEATKVADLILGERNV